MIPQKKEQFIAELDLVWGYPCSRIHRLNTWAKNSSKIFQNSVQNFSTRLSPHYMAEKKGNVIHSKYKFFFTQITQDLLLGNGNEGSFSCLRCKKLPCAAYCQQQNPYDSLFCPLRYLNGNKVSGCTDNSFNKIYYTIMNTHSAVTAFRGNFIFYLNWIMTVPNFQFGVFVVVHLNMCTHMHVTHFSILPQYTTEEHKLLKLHL